MKTLSWLSIVRLGLVQASLGAIIVLMTSTLNRIMVVELALPAIVPGALITLHHAMQLLRPRMGFGSDVGQRRTPWIVGGMATLALGGVGAAISVTLVKEHFAVGMALAVLAFALIGAGVSAAGTSLLVLMAKRVAQERRAAAATIVWMMMIVGFAVTATLAGKLLDPFSNARLITVFGAVCGGALLVSMLAIAGVEGSREAPVQALAEAAPKPGFVAVLRETWAEPAARRFTIFVFVSMLAYSAQDLILEPFAGAVFRFTPGESTKLSGAQHGGVFAGMVVVAIVTTLFKNTMWASIKAWVVGGCLASAAALSGLVIAGMGNGDWPLRENVFLLGVANGAFAISAIGAMMTLAGQGRREREGVRMGLWGASQSIAFGLGGLLGTVLVDLAKPFVHAPAHAYAFVFAIEAAAFIVATLVAFGTAFKPERDTVRIEGEGRLSSAS